MANHQERKPKQLSLPLGRAPSPRVTEEQHHQVVLLLAQFLLSTVPPPSRGDGAATEAGDEPY
ncbi:hypothetical protein OWM54_09365 [Myxococcus sp. MISCRS1]|uniref:hypothetical protein n=1 Tax=Myxococcus TaxID=32 RepID=UPI0022711123|nr:hypothetical protein [Myxococcus sp. MISCRS1]MCY0997341.1 hypothetical protein [Myxococcus sp. MISCRS1]BDT35629.1 hypothetical protein MFMH1_52980 [Myxococcus sp. MH1]